ncbi:unnamed protein product [Phytophthora fragariaefolia]|uniref:Unnamed protein product n=1 Tax=Phytophthora fragariaefolia TaxID=1490495 RepID=A0A9W6YNL8_9STRA|nr:unnamed protein product [Phytophthora fragariaefolia]
MMSLLLDEWPEDVSDDNAQGFRLGGDGHVWLGNQFTPAGFAAAAPEPFAPTMELQSNGSMMSLLLNGWSQDAAAGQVVEVKTEGGRGEMVTVGSDAPTIKMESAASESRIPRKRALCSHPACEKIAQSQGLCVAHGGKRCVHPNCTKSAQLHGLCITHGGSRTCSFPDCTKMTRSAGRCFEHGGGKQCAESGCVKQAQARGLCNAHGKSRSERTKTIGQTIIL